MCCTRAYFGYGFDKIVVSLSCSSQSLHHSHHGQMNLHSVEPMQVPEHLTFVPHDYQLKGAAQILHACGPPFYGLMVGHAMGLGKTNMAVLSMIARREERGMFVVVCPASITEQWKRSIEGAMEVVRPTSGSFDDCR